MTSISSELPSIFVSIASYRDPDCQNTIDSLFEMASYPNRVFVGVCLQRMKADDSDCAITNTHSGCVRIDEVKASESRGACWARNRAQRLWQGEDYFFQIDSHMRFVRGWDQRLLEMVSICPSEKPVLSTYPLEFTPPDTFAPEMLATIRAKGFDENGILLQNSWLSAVENAPEIPAPVGFISAGMLFAPSEIVREVPYDPSIYFSGEEISLAVRLWTHGWDIFQPNKVIAYHNYGKQPERPRHWEDQIDWVKLGNESKRRLHYVLGITDDDIGLSDIEQFGTGTARTLAEYEHRFHLDFKLRLLNGTPHLLPALAADHANQADRRKKIFGDIWQNNGWKNPETRSGSGSTLQATAGLRKWLPDVIRSFDIQSLNDVGCGDLNWVAETLPQLRFYFGFDIVPDLISDLSEKHSREENRFFKVADVVKDALPASDAILCRDCLTHLPLDAALLALQIFRKSGARILMATTHATGMNCWIENGGWYPMDLTAAPFNLPEPLLALNEGGTKRLGVWRL